MTKKDKIITGILAGASLIIVLGIMFLLSAAEIANIFPFMKNIDNVLVRYIIVILTMATGIMGFSNACAQYGNLKLRKGLNIGITAFSTVLTVPLVYVFVAIFFAANGKIGPVGETMMLDRIVEGFVSWFGDGGFLYVVFVFMLILSLVFIAVPIITCVQVVKKTNAEMTRSSAESVIAVADMIINATENVETAETPVEAKEEMVETPIDVAAKTETAAQEEPVDESVEAVEKTEEVTNDEPVETTETTENKAE